MDSSSEREASFLKASREREEYLFDRVLQAKQIRPVALKDKELPKPQVFVSSEEIAELTDRLNERVEAGIMSEIDANAALSDVRSGRKTQAQVDMNIWQAQSTKLPGSVVEPI